MNGNRVWYLIGGIAIIAILALGWFLGVSPLLDAAAASDAERATVEAENDAQNAVLADMKEQYAQLDELNAQLAELQLSVPAEGEVDAFFDLVVRIAYASGVTISSMTTGEGELYGGAAATTTAPATPATDGVSAPTVTSVALTPSPGLAANLYAVPITIVLDNDPTTAGPFIKMIQRAQRLMLVNSVTSAAAPPQTTISGYLFVVSSSVPAAAVAPTDGTPTPAPTPGPTDVAATPAPTGTSIPTPTETPAP